MLSRKYIYNKAIDVLLGCVFCVVEKTRVVLSRRKEISIGIVLFKRTQRESVLEKCLFDVVKLNDEVVFFFIWE